MKVQIRVPRGETHDIEVVRQKQDAAGEWKKTGGFRLGPGAEETIEITSADRFVLIDRDRS